MRNITDEEFKIASRYLFLSMAIEVIQKDLNTLRNNSIFKINEPYIKLLEVAERKAIEERKKLKQQMHINQLKVLLTDRSEGGFTEYTYYAKRKEEKRRYFNPAIRKKVLLILRDLLRVQVKPIKET
ncbi:hypothetical protein JCM21714_2048 [Gracilibacillus boraciitolerans JCM 21714]|uniref:Uncharacterized protein n=1 Tax=Gracilibacillus boraciitolerans JCM 21714 TaxID=1298598 RepID=W4VJM6_9BACI|nr:hypothetical protein [Gracilibacillus boraciitolerans]GAE93018.1 hypothetical protein JCM21714_2048 [Gracilibacillus boraciitolerans JCM 21714]